MNVLRTKSEYFSVAELHGNRQQTDDRDETGANPEPQLASDVTDQSVPTVATLLDRGYDCEWILDLEDDVRLIIWNHQSNLYM